MSEIAEIGKIRLVESGQIASPAVVRNRYAAVRPLAEFGVAARGWTLDVLRLIQRIGQRRFSIADAYSFAPELSKLHPNNRNIKAKIRQQLQVLRDLGFLRFVARGEYEVSSRK